MDNQIQVLSQLSIFFPCNATRYCAFIHRVKITGLKKYTCYRQISTINQKINSLCMENKISTQIRPLCVRVCGVDIQIIT